MNTVVRHNFKTFFLALTTFFFVNSDLKSQELVIHNDTSKNRIVWEGQIPLDSKQPKKNVTKKIRDFIIGKKDLQLKKPISLLAYDKSNYWILDQDNKAVLLWNEEILKFPYFIDKKDFNLASLVGICKYHDQNFLFTDSYLNKIFIVDPGKKECHILNDSLKILKPTGIAYSAIKKQIWVLETGQHRILVLNEKGEIIKIIGKRGTQKGEFNFPTHIWIDKSGKAFIVDAMNFRVQVLDAEGNVISVFGKSGDATGYFASPKGIATDSYGNIYVADALFHAVQIFDINGNFLYTFGTQGQSKGQFWMPSGIYIDEQNKIYVADTYNSRIQIFQLIKGGK